jgi:dipeptidyl aminopeptidase/acylaminoacyl peptidase
LKLASFLFKRLYFLSKDDKIDKGMMINLFNGGKGMKKIATVILVLIASVSLFAAQTKQPITFDDLISIGRVSDPQISPDGKEVAFVVTYYSKETNRGNSDIWIVPFSGGEPTKLTNDKAADFHPRFSPDGKKLAFISGRSGKAQIWILPLDGGEAMQLTNLWTGASSVEWSPDGKYLAFVSRVYPDAKSDEENKKRDLKKAKSKVKARIIDHLLYRHWASWRNDKWSHLFIIPAEGGTPRDLTPGYYDVPAISLGGNPAFSFSPDGKEICFEMNTDPEVAISTNNDLFVVPVSGGEPKRITVNKANDNQPIYSPDGRYIAFRAHRRPGFEADRNQLMLYHRKSGKITSLTRNFDRSVSDIVWSPDSKYLYFTADDEGYSSIYVTSIENRGVEKLIGKSFNSNLRITPNSKFLLFCRQSMNHPVDIYVAFADGTSVKQLTDVNRELLSQLEMNPAEEFWFEGAEGIKVHSFLLKPPGFDPTKKYPMVYLIHGGPQSAWHDVFHYRWNAQMFAAPGYVTVMVNPRGSTGYGQKFTDEISGDWGGKVFVDLMKGVDYVLANYPFIDKEKLAAAGASYGGYMINWIEGHTDRFRCLVNHDGVFNTVSMYFSTEELWFPEWEFKGTPWESKEVYEKWSPHNYVAKFNTPMLIIHGEQDFRVSIDQGLQVFTALQRKGIPSKLLYFPDEGHWVLKPLNAELWWNTIYDWLATYIK